MPTLPHLIRAITQWENAGSDEIRQEHEKEIMSLLQVREEIELAIERMAKINYSATPPGARGTKGTGSGGGPVLIWKRYKTAAWLTGFLLLF